MKKKKYILSTMFIIMMMFVLIACVSKDNSNMVVRDEGDAFGEAGYVRTATYFSDEWQVNFWNSEMDDLEEELAQIKSDGFDSIVLMIPWREFQPSVQPIEYNEYAFSMLDIVMKAAKDQDLDVYTRIGYTWDYYEDNKEWVTNRFNDLLRVEAVRNAWLDYVGTMYRELAKYDNFEFGFLTWEDFWNVLNLCDEDDEKRRYNAAALGYIEWVVKNYSLEEYNERYGTEYLDFTEIVLPKKNEPAMYSMYEFFDEFLMEILEESQEVFPNLSMEVRIDWDVFTDINGEIGYYRHNKTYDCADSDFTSVMYGIPMGFENVGEKVTYEEAMMKTEYILSELKKNNGGKAVYVEQFLFKDNTVGFSHNAQIIEEQVDEYLENISGILLEHSEGYGIWTYRDYCRNIIYNPQFALKLQGWTSKGRVSVKKINGSNVCILNPNSGVYQEVPQMRGYSPSTEFYVDIDVKQIEKEGGHLTIQVGADAKTIEVLKLGVYRVAVNAESGYNLSIEADCKVGIDNIKLYSHIQNGYLYDVNNNELDCIDSIRKLNQELKEGSKDKNF